MNATIKALNENDRMPRIIVIIPDDDIFKYIDCYKEDVILLAGAALTWIINQIDRAMDCKKQDLMQVRPGAVFASEPKVIWVKALDKWKSNTDEAYATDKFNDTLAEILMDKKGHYLIDLTEEMNNPALFTQWGELNSDGRIRFWTEMDYRIKGFDQHKILLKPKARIDPVLEFINRQTPKHGHGKHGKSSDKKARERYEQQHHRNSRSQSPRKDFRK